MYRPVWFRTVLRDNPALVADVLRRSAARKLATGVQRATELHELAKAEDHREVAELISLSVLEHFPKAETEVALQALCWALNAALKTCDWSAVDRVIEERLGRGGQGAGEYGCWLAAGYLVAPERYREDLRGLADDEGGLKSLAMFVAAGRFPKDFAQRFAVGDFKPLVAALGAAYRRPGLTESAYRSATDLIATLGGDPSAAATEALKALSRVADAEPWEPAIADATERQARKRREHEYRHSGIGKVVQTLDGGTPASAGDLAALVFDELKALSRQDSRCKHVGLAPALERRPHTIARRQSEARERMPGRGAVRSAGTAQPVWNRRPSRRPSYTEDNRSDIRASALPDSMFRWRSSEAATVTSGRRSEVS